MADGGTSKKQQAAAPEDGVTAFFVLGKRAERRIGRREWAQGWRLAEDDQRQRCAGAGGELGENGRTI